MAAMMLETLRNIVQEVNAAEGLNDALQIIVKRVRDAMGTEVCSVYMRDEASGRFVFRATEGLNPLQVGEASLAPGEGLSASSPSGKNRSTSRTQRATPASSCWKVSAKSRSTPSWVCPSFTSAMCWAC